MPPVGGHPLACWPVGYGGEGWFGLCPLWPVPVPCVGVLAVGRSSVPLCPRWAVCGGHLLAVGGHLWGGLCPCSCSCLSYRGGREYSSPLLACSCGRFARWFAIPPNLAVFVPCDGQTGGGAVILPLCSCWRSVGGLFDICQYFFYEVGGVCPVGIIII